MPRVFLPPSFKSLAGGCLEFQVEAKNVREAIEALDSQFSGVLARLCEDGELKPGLTVAVDGNVSSLGMIQKVKPESELHFLPAIGGG